LWLLFDALSKLTCFSHGQTQVSGNWRRLPTHRTRRTEQNIDCFLWNSLDSQELPRRPM